MTLDFILLCIAGLLGTAVFAGVQSRHRNLNTAVYSFAMLATAISGSFACLQLTGLFPVPVIELPLGLAWMHMHFRLDALSAFFLVVLNLVGVLTSLYGISYGRHESEPWRVLPFYPLFLAGMSLVTIADDAYTFLLSWEFMSLSSWFLVLAKHKEQDTLYAAYVYIIMACIGTLALFMAFGLFAFENGGDLSFAAMRAHPLAPALAAAIMVLVLIGAGAKAGIVPLHAWLPLAHPAAPSHVSALMSGVMTKVAIYGMLRLLFDLAGPPQFWWGSLLLGIGSLTAFIGILYAILQDDLKRLLAFSTVKNIGIIMAALGLALAFRFYNFPALAALAMTAALFHVFNHALFKSLLFLASGAVLAATGQRNMARMGGLIHAMPITAGVFLVGATAISALPPLNGFVSEWLMFQALLHGFSFPVWLMKFQIPLAGALIALSAALAGACFVKVFGIVFLGRARSEAMTAAREVDSVMLAPMVILAALCGVVGVFPTCVLALIRPAVAVLAPTTALPMQHSSWVFLIPQELAGSSYSGLIILLMITVMASGLIFLIHHYASNKMRRSAAWDCGFPSNFTNTQYTPSSFAQPLRRVFATSLLGAQETVDMPAPGETRAAHLYVQIPDPIWTWFYLSVERLIKFLTAKIDVVQTFGIRRQLSLMFGALVLLLVAVAVLQ